MPQTQSLMISFRLSPLRTVWPDRVKEKDCPPAPMATWKALGPALALKVWLLRPESTVTVPGDFRSAMTKTESCIVSYPFGLPTK